MPIDLNGACASMMLSATKEPELDWLTLTAMEDGTEVRLDKECLDAAVLTAELQYRIGKGKWQDYTWNDKRGLNISLPTTGDTCQFRAKTVNQTFSNGGYKSAGYYNFIISKRVIGTGNIMSLLDSALIREDVPDGAFSNLFFLQKTFSSEIKLPAVKLGNYCYNSMFNGTNTSKVPLLPAKEIEIGSYNTMLQGCNLAHIEDIGVFAENIKRNSFRGFARFNSNLESVKLNIKSFVVGSASALEGAFFGCSKLKEIRIKFSDWGANETTDWVKNVSPTGDFYCPADLPLIWDDSHIPIGWTAHPEGKEPVPYPDPLEDKYLRFTAEQDGSLLRLDKSADVPELNARLEYKVNAGNWEEYTWGEDEGVTDKKLGHLISLPTAGDCVKWRAVDRNERFSVSFGNYYVFNMDKPIACAGNVMSLLDKTCELLTVPKYGFNNLFKKAKITSYPLLPALQMTGTGGYYSLFYNVNTLKDKSIVISIKSFEANSYGIGYTFYENTQLNNITVNFPMWPFSAGNSNWVKGVSPHGVFTCPSDLPVIFGDSNIPHGWTVNNGLTEPSEEEILNACYQYVNGQLKIQPDFKACLNRAEQIDYVKHGKTYWKAGTPLPNPHRPDIDAYYKVTSLHQLFRDFSQMKSFDLSLWVLPELKNATQILWACSSLESIDLSPLSFANVTTKNISYAFFQCSNAVSSAVCLNQSDADKLNASIGKPTTWEFVVKPPEVK